MNYDEAQTNTTYGLPRGATIVAFDDIGYPTSLAPWRLGADTIATIALRLSAIFAISSLALRAINRRAVSRLMYPGPHY